MLKINQLAIKSAVSNGRIVIIPEETLHINQWSGSGYMVLDPDTYACGYMISGGLSGGAMTLEQMFCEYVSQVVMGIVFMVMWKMLTATLLAMCPCGWGVALGLAINFAENIMLLSLVTEMVALVVKYAQTGEVIYLQELLIQIAALGTLTLVSKLASGKIEELTDKVGEEIERAGLKGACFVAGTLVVSQKKVETTFEKQTSEIMHISVNKEIIDATTNHPFYVLDRGFVKAKDLRAGDILCTVNGDNVVVEQVQHEILESTVNVYNFSVEDNHTYFVGK